MAPFIFFTALFLLGLLNSYFNLSSTLKPLLFSFFFKKPIPTSTKKPIQTNKKKKKKSPEFAEELETVFSTFDGDGDGFITLKELEVSLKRLKIPVTPGEVESMMEKVDANGDGLIDVEEFGNLYESLRSTRGNKDQEVLEEDGELREAFEVFDENKDGVITVEELGEVLVSMGLKRRGEVESDCEEMIRRVDLDGDGMVNFEEFKKMMVMGQG